MDKLHFEKTDPNTYEEPIWELDVVCGMDVDPRTTPYHHSYKDQVYHFCNKSCLVHFVSNPEHYSLMKQHHLNVRKSHSIS